MSDDLMDRLREVTGGKLDYTNTPNSLRLAARDRIEELEDHLASMTGLWAKSDSEKQLLLGRIEELETKLDDKEAECRHLRGQVGLLQAKLAEAERVARYESDIAQQALDQMRAAEAALRALPTPTAAELMARIQTGENK